jgi:hypothetical protein
MHKEVLNKKQLSLLDIVKHFSDKGFYLAGGTALALQIGHRESIDFDIFSYDKFENQDIYKDLLDLDLNKKDFKVVIDKLDEYTLFIKDVKFTFLRYPFHIEDIIQEERISLADTLNIGAMKAYALGRRSKWKDYVDLYILLQKISLDTLISKANTIFDDVFSEKMFRQQLCYFEDVDFSEEVIWRIDKPPKKEKIVDFLKNIAVKE